VIFKPEKEDKRGKEGGKGKKRRLRKGTRLTPKKHHLLRETRQGSRRCREHLKSKGKFFYPEDWGRANFFLNFRDESSNGAREEKGQEE